MANDHGRLEPVSMCGYLLKVARLDAPPLQRPGTLCVRAFLPSTKNFTPLAKMLMIDR